MMILVAVVGLAMGADVARRRWASLADGYREKAQKHRSYSAFFQADALARNNGPQPGQSATEVEAAIAHFDRIANHYKMLIDKYDRAASRPWEAVEPDPPEPE